MIGPSIPDPAQHVQSSFSESGYRLAPLSGGFQLDVSSHSVIGGSDHQSGYRQMQCVIKPKIPKHTRTRLAVIARIGLTSGPLEWVLDRAAGHLIIKGETPRSDDRHMQCMVKPTIPKYLPIHSVIYRRIALSSAPEGGDLKSTASQMVLSNGVDVILGSVAS
jgi:hypothetical protein